jgi:hypothetical protein
VHVPLVDLFFPVQTFVQDWRLLLHDHPTLLQAALASRPPKARAPTATAPAIPRKACRRDRAWPKLRTSPSKRSESILTPSIRYARGHTSPDLRNIPLRPEAQGPSSRRRRSEPYARRMGHCLRQAQYSGPGASCQIRRDNSSYPHLRRCFWERSGAAGALRACCKTFLLHWRGRARRPSLVMTSGSANP